jgi:hypothetical protein
VVVIVPVEETTEGTLEEQILAQILESSHELPEKWPVIIIQGCLTLICSTIETVNEETIQEPVLSLSKSGRASKIENEKETEKGTASPEETRDYLNINPLVVNTTGLTSF